MNRVLDAVEYIAEVCQRFAGLSDELGGGADRHIAKRARSIVDLYTGVALEYDVFHYKTWSQFELLLDKFDAQT